MKVAPSDWTSSLTAGRTSYADTTAPRRRAVAIACSPANPAPMTRAGRARPGLDADLKAGGHEHLRRLGNQGDAALSLLALLGDGHLHDWTTLRNSGPTLQARRILNPPSPETKVK